jgi:hypothetical protein
MRISKPDEVRNLPKGKLRVLPRNAEGEEKKFIDCNFTTKEAVDAADFLFRFDADLRCGLDTQAEAMAMVINGGSNPQFSEALAL